MYRELVVPWRKGYGGKTLLSYVVTSVMGYVGGWRLRANSQDGGGGNYPETRQPVWGSGNKSHKLEPTLI